jgi:hypothetical protein
LLFQVPVIQSERLSIVSSSLKEAVQCDLLFSFKLLVRSVSRSEIILLLAAGVLVGAHGNNQIPGSPS